MEKGKLFICGTPMGNLEDISKRVLKTLKKADIIAAEDTRRTGQLLNYFDIKNRMISYHEHNEKRRAEEILGRLQSGENIALVSDAGMPGISDPGQIITKMAVKNGIEVIPVPGPTAFVSALVVSGFDLSRFVFLGFIPRSTKERDGFIDEISLEEKTAVFYESPYRLLSTLKEFADYSSELAERDIMVARELSKIHEEKIYGNTIEIIEKLNSREIKGEVVVVVSGRKKIKEEEEGWENLSILEHIKLLMNNGFSKKEAIKKVADLRDLPKSEVYRVAVAIKIDKQ
ncbi:MULTISPECIES: 16S rRNA (cytidine(1402)-2'-O)-methyltransferase [unclassified Halanaerobium]|uniref:16S rRNA (cytidine(1402)-2'-O)-methyltransferase n=1 Tax=unclassified Halanaerobium TaxID=2641197 RepID=UPI000DF442B5|nr:MULTISPECIES: 16S rRNA (cytidine(1402)-2'-O)-methyltransferase [unclassified Halanaerobium]